MKFIAPCLLVSVLSGPALSFAATVSLDTDPLTAGNQSTLTITPGSSFIVDVVVENLASNELLRGFEFDADFDSSILNPLDVVDGGFLLTGAGLFEAEKDLTAPDVNYAETTLGAFGLGATGGGVLASITFQALVPGTSALDLNDVLLAVLDSNTSLISGISPSVSDINDAVVTVTAVPLPGALILMLFGLGSLFGFGIHKKSLDRDN